VNHAAFVSIEYAGAILSIAGAFFVTSQSATTRLFAFCLWVIADLMLVPLFWDKQLPALVAMQVVYFCLSAFGVYTNYRAIRLNHDKDSDYGPNQDHSRH
jgi:nicotinamide riboside transporter PnuC